ncbi:MAG: capsule assembly Wzi family protein [Woeseiaceae bacterium]|nr:capsule assembly Wzi family protein [Woeseiaceae bacterium]
MRISTLVLLLLIACVADASPLADPGNVQFRHDLELLNDMGVIDVPLTAWPVALSDIRADLGVLPSSSSVALAQAYRRVSARLNSELDVRVPRFNASLSGAVEPRFIRGFDDTPRDEGEITTSVDWIGERFAFRLSATAVANPFDGDEFRPDGTWIGVALGNWMLTAGWQDRWWGPGRDGSLILSTNARPAPGLMLQRNLSTPFESRLLSWMGPWTVTTFMSWLDDDRVVEDALLFGIRGSIRPPGTGLEIGISRSAQWCGNDRPCDLGVFGDLLVGNDNRGVNVDADEEPGNQLGGFDIRWRLPKGVPAALYMQWIGEDGRGGGGAIGSWLRQLGLEAWGEIGGFSHRTHFEVSDTTCRQGGFGFSGMVPNCAYEHFIYTTGYRYQGRSIAHGADGDSLAYSIGSTLVQSAGNSWSVLLRHMEINRVGTLLDTHTLSLEPYETTDVLVSHSWRTQWGAFNAGVGYMRVRSSSPELHDSDVSAFIRWSSR